MSTSFVRRCISLYRMMDANTKAIYRTTLGLDGNAKIIDVEHALGIYEHQRNNIGELILDMEAEIDYLNGK